MIERFDNLANGKHPLSTTKAEDDLGAWLDNADDVNSRSAKCAHPKPDLGSVENYWCAWCACPGTQLRQCISCKRVRLVFFSVWCCAETLIFKAIFRYCDLGCQQAHAPEHRAACGSVAPTQPAPPKPPSPPSTGNARAWVGYPPNIPQIQPEIPGAPGYICEAVRTMPPSLLIFLTIVADRLMESPQFIKFSIPKTPASQCFRTCLTLG